MKNLAVFSGQIFTAVHRTQCPSAESRRHHRNRANIELFRICPANGKIISPKTAENVFSRCAEKWLEKLTPFAIRFGKDRQL